MELSESVKKLLNTQHQIQVNFNKQNPAWLSQMMAEMSLWTGAVEEKLSDYEKDYETQPWWACK